MVTMIIKTVRSLGFINMLYQIYVFEICIVPWKLNISSNSDSVIFSGYNDMTYSSSIMGLEGHGLLSNLLICGIPFLSHDQLKTKISQSRSSEEW